MLSVTEKASTELKKVLSSEKATGKELVIFFQGYG
jgi:Fe-S cluster assembly iron-binding protein IscA